jgi:hypothetical protein
MLIFEDGSCFAVRVFKIGEFAQYGSSPADEEYVIFLTLARTA